MEGKNGIIHPTRYSRSFSLESKVYFLYNLSYCILYIYGKPLKPRLREILINKKEEFEQSRNIFYDSKLSHEFIFRGQRLFSWDLETTLERAIKEKNQNLEKNEIENKIFERFL